MEKFSPEWWAALAEAEEACRCPYCGRVVLCGPACCEPRAKDARDAWLRERGQHPEQIAARQAAKRERRLERRRLKRETDQ